MISVISGNILDEIQTTCADISVYDYIYISVGSKENDHVVYFNGGKQVHSNAFMQMVPLFLHKPGANVLIISIDTFKHTHQISSHVRKLENIVTDNIHFLLINHFCDAVFIDNFMHVFIKKLNQTNFPAARFMITNFIRHKHSPNAIEKQSEEIIPTTIQTALDSTATYGTCFFQWFGYNPMFYNYVYNYKRLKSNPVVYNHIYAVEDLLTKLSRKTLSEKIVIQNMSVVFILQHMYNFCQYNNLTDRIAFSIHDELIREESIVIVT